MTTDFEKLPTSETTMDLDTKYNFKIVILGDGATGKTSICLRYIYDDFVKDEALTYGLRFNSFHLTAQEDNKKFQIGASVWDFGGQDRYQSLIPQFILGANACFLIFDLNSYHSLKNLKSIWRPFVTDHASNIPIVLIGNKVDIVEEDDYRPISAEEINLMKEELGACEYIETSAKTGHNIKHMFKEITQKILMSPPYNESNVEIL